MGQLRCNYGDAPNRDFIWGAYVPQNSDGSGFISFAYSALGDTEWSYFPDGDGFGLDEIPNEDTELADMGLWAYFSAARQVPEPMALSLIGGGLIGMRLLRRRALS